MRKAETFIGKPALTRCTRITKHLPEAGVNYSGTIESARGPAHSKTLARPRLLPKTRSVLECGSPLPLSIAEVDDCADQTDQTAKVTRVVDVRDAHETRQIHDPQIGCHAFP